MPADGKNIPKSSKVMDVTQPGKSTPSASGRPIIVTNRPLIKQDPMVLDSSEGQETAAAVSRVGRSIRIEPIDANDDSLKAVAPAKPQPKGEVPIEVKGAKLSLKPLAEPAEDSKPAPSPEPAPEPANEATPEPAATPEPPVSEPIPPGPTTPAPSASPADTPDQTDEQEMPAGDKQLAASKALEDAKKKEEDEKAARVAEQEKIIDSKKYYLPISGTRDSRDLHLALILLLAVIVLGVVWLDIALDAGIIKINGLHALTHFFK